MRSTISGIQIPTAARLNIDGEFTLDSLAGTSGHMLISQGAGNTPAWSNTLTSPTIDIINAASSSSTTANIFGNVTTGTVGLADGITTGTVNIATAATSLTGRTVNINTNATGTITVTTNIGSNTLGGTINLYSGLGYINLIGEGLIRTQNKTSANSASLVLNTGTTTTSGNSGGITIDVGSAAGTAGTISIGTQTQSGITIGRSGVSTTINGNASFGSGIALSAGTSSRAPIDLTAGTNLTTPVYGAVEAATDNIYITNNPGSNSTGPGRGIVLAPQMVFSLANSSTANASTATSAFASANDVLSVLEANKLYRFRAKYYSSFTYSGQTGNISMLFAFSNAPTAIKYSYRTYPQTANSTTNTSMGTYSVTTASLIVPTQSSSGTWVTEVDGYFTTHATNTSTFTPQFTCSAASSSTAVIQAGSWFEIEKLGTSTTTLIAGNWA